MTEFPANRTPFTGPQLVNALTDACKAQLGEVPPHATMAIIAAQIAFETAGGREAYDYDLGNFKAVPGADYQSFQTWEVIDGKRVPMLCRFAAFSSLESGAEAYLYAIITRWGAAWHFACLGDSAGFVHALKSAKYFTGDEGDYASGVVRWVSFFMALLGGDPAPTEPELLAPAAAAVEALTGLLDPDATLPPDSAA